MPVLPEIPNISWTAEVVQSKCIFQQRWAANNRKCSVSYSLIAVLMQGPCYRHNTWAINARGRALGSRTLSHLHEAPGCLLCHRLLFLSNLCRLTCRQLLCFMPRFHFRLRFAELWILTASTATFLFRLLLYPRHASHRRQPCHRFHHKMGLDLKGELANWGGPPRSGWSLSQAFRVLPSQASQAQAEADSHICFILPQKSDLRKVTKSDLKIPRWHSVVPQGGGLWAYRTLHNETKPDVACACFLWKQTAHWELTIFLAPFLHIHGISVTRMSNGLVLPKHFLSARW